ncbi:unnamed protein product [Symbiodinium sp. CCMP2456]|nr:unnamed protein product [Symbiodinium sp. CCMP2456]
MAAAFRKEGAQNVLATGSMVNSINKACDLADLQRSAIARAFLLRTWKTDEGDAVFCGGRSDSEVQMRNGLKLIKDPERVSKATHNASEFAIS